VAGASQTEELNFPGNLACEGDFGGKFKQNKEVLIHSKK